MTKGHFITWILLVTVYLFTTVSLADIAVENIGTNWWYCTIMVTGFTIGFYSKAIYQYIKDN